MEPYYFYGQLIKKDKYVDITPEMDICPNFLNKGQNGEKALLTLGLSTIGPRSQKNLEDQCQS